MFFHYSLFLTPFLLLCSFLLTRYYISAARNLQRLHRVSYSPIITILSETINGIETIRAEKVEANFKRKIYQRLDDHYAVHLYIEGCEKWFKICQGIFSHFFFGIILVVALFNKNQVSAQAIGLVLNNSEMFTLGIVKLLELYSKIEVSMVCLERCEAYTEIQGEKIPNEKDNIEIEKKFNIGKIYENLKDEKKFIRKIKQKWPSQGKIEFKGFSARYRPNTPIVLNNINLVINPYEKFGIVGRTGSGKSSFI